ncbi:MAG: hypothetical protein V7633_5404, partial [Pseudonocardia sp.]
MYPEASGSPDADPAVAGPASGVPCTPDRGAAQETAPDWDVLPDPVRARLAEVASAALGGMPATDVPAGLRRFSRFTPAKRARLGGAALVAELRDS